MLAISGAVVCNKQLKTLLSKKLIQSPLVQTALQEAFNQLAHYQQVLIATYQKPQRLKCLAVPAVDFEKVVWQLL